MPSYRTSCLSLSQIPGCCVPGKATSAAGEIWKCKMGNALVLDCIIKPNTETRRKGGRKRLATTQCCRHAFSENPLCKCVERLTWPWVTFPLFYRDESIANPVFHMQFPKNMLSLPKFFVVLHFPPTRLPRQPVIVSVMRFIRTPMIISISRQDKSRNAPSDGRCARCPGWMIMQYVAWFMLAADSPANWKESETGREKGLKRGDPN